MLGHVNAEEREEGALDAQRAPWVECPRLSNSPLGEQDNSPRIGRAQGALERLADRYEEITAGQTLHPPRATVTALRGAASRTCSPASAPKAIRRSRSPSTGGCPSATTAQAIRMVKVQQKAAWQHQVKRSCLVGQPEHAVVEPGCVEGSTAPGSRTDTPSRALRTKERLLWTAAGVVRPGTSVPATARASA